MMTQQQVDQVQVDKMVAQARTANPAQRKMVADRLAAMIARGERCNGVSLETMQAAVDAIRAL